MRLFAEIRETSPLQRPGVSLRTEDGTELFQLVIVPAGYRKTSDAEARAMSHQIVALLNEDIDGIMVDDTVDRRPQPPSWIDQSGARSPVKRAAIVIGEDVPRDSTGEIIVPSRRKDETPEEKKIRRALRKARNQERAAKGAPQEKED